MIDLQIKNEVDVQVDLVSFKAEGGNITGNAAIVLRSDHRRRAANWVSMQVDTEPGYDGIAVEGADGGQGIWQNLLVGKPKLPVTLRMVYNGKKATFYINGKKEGEKQIQVSDFFVGLSGVSPRTRARNMREPHAKASDSSSSSDQGNRL